MKTWILKRILPVAVFFGMLIFAASPALAVSQTLYVDGALTWVDYGTYVHGPINAPYLTITEAVNALDADGGIIYVAEGTYNENLTLNNLVNVEIRGGYNGGPGDTDPFTTQDTQGQKSTLNGYITGANISGKLTGLTFAGQSGFSYLISVNNTLTGKNFEVSDNYFSFDSVTNYFIKISSASGCTALIKDNLFAWAGSDQSIIDTAGAGNTTVEKNHFNLTSSRNGSYGIIRATDGAVVKNNLIQDSAADNRVGIRVVNSAEVYNNTLVGGTFSTGAIATSGTGHTVYNNLVANITGTDFVFAAGATESNNLNDTDCTPAFVGGTAPASYKLGATSTCIDAGRAVSGVTDDFFGTSRPSGGAYDVGFSEFYVAPACGNTFIESGEQCDDGNTTNGDGCSSTCQDEPADAAVVDCGDWYDINATDSHYAIAVYLCEHGEIVRGDSYGNLRIDDKLTRAELLAMAFRAREYENLGVVDVNAEACFLDVTTDWYAKYFCTAKDEGFVQGYPDGTAKPGSVVLLAEALKMMLGALDKYYTIDAGDCWYCSMIWSAEPHGWLPFQFDSPTDIGPMELSRRYAMDMLYRIMTE